MELKPPGYPALTKLEKVLQKELCCWNQNSSRQLLTTLFLDVTAKLLTPEQVRIKNQGTSQTKLQLDLFLNHIMQQHNTTESHLLQNNSFLLLTTSLQQILLAQEISVLLYTCWSLYLHSPRG